MMARKGKQSTSDAGGSSDIVIPVMGATGAGKSTFINQVLGRETRTVGHTIDSCTSKISMEHVDPSKLPRTRLNLFNGRKVYLVDTPGFDDTFKDDVEILQQIAKWLKESYGKRTLGGVIYLHDISADRFTGTAKRNLVMFNKLCGEDVLGNVIIGLTKTSRIGSDETARREHGLKTRQWKDMIDKGVRVLQVADAVSSGQALTLFKSILETFEKNVFLNIQREIVVKRKMVPETEAGMELRLTLQQVLELQKKFASSQSSDTPDNLEDAKKQLEILHRQLQALKIPFSRRLLNLLGF